MAWPLRPTCPICRTTSRFRVDKKEKAGADEKAGVPERPKKQSSRRYFTVKLGDKSIEVSPVLYTDESRSPEPVYMSSPSNALWPCLIEKAYAQMLGDYGKLEGSEKRQHDLGGRDRRCAGCFRGGQSHRRDDSSGGKTRNARSDHRCFDRSNHLPKANFRDSTDSFCSAWRRTICKSMTRAH